MSRYTGNPSRRAVPSVEYNIVGNIIYVHAWILLNCKIFEGALDFGRRQEDYCFGNQSHVREVLFLVKEQNLLIQ